MSSSLNEELVNLLASRFSREEVISLLNSNNETLVEAIHISVQSINLASWRAAWLLHHSMSVNDQRFIPYADLFIQAIPGKADGHQRELIKILSKLPLNDDQEGQLFDHCMTIWEKIGNSPSSRMFAFRFIAKTAKKYPELVNELSFLTQPEYIEALSPGVRRSTQRLVDELIKLKV